MAFKEEYIVDGKVNSARTEAQQTDARFIPLDRCWVCRGSQLSRVLQDYFDFTTYNKQDPELSQYSGSSFWLVRCQDCGFMQPDVLPTLRNFFDRMYDQRWSDDWIEQEFDNGCKDFIFRGVLRQLSRRISPPTKRKLLDIGAHVGRLIHLADKAEWQAEGIELNPLTSSYAARRTALPIHRVSAQQLLAEGRKYDAVTMIDVLEHIPDPVAMLRTTSELLITTGWLAVKVPCGPNQLLKERVRSRLHRDYKLSVAGNLVHVNHFSPLSLRRALKEAGFTNIKLYVAAPELSPTNTGHSALASLSDAMRLSVYYLARFLPGGLHTPLALNLQAYAQKADTDRDVSAN